MIDYEYNGKIFKIIPKEEMLEGEFYIGFCRNARIAQWVGEKFIYVRNKYNFEFLEKIKHPEDEYHFDVFMPQAVAVENTDSILKLKEMLCTRENN